MRDSPPKGELEFSPFKPCCTCQVWGKFCRGILNLIYILFLFCFQVDTPTTTPKDTHSQGRKINVGGIWFKITDSDADWHPRGESELLNENIFFYLINSSVFYICLVALSASTLCLYVAVNFFISLNFCFSFLLNSLAYITIPKNNGKVKITENKKLTVITTYTCISPLFISTQS